MKNWLRLQAGFTMIELILVIAIIGIVAAAVIGAINPVTQIKRANDAQRRSNVKQLQNALEQYFSDGNNAYTCDPVALKPFLPDGIPNDPASHAALTCLVPAPGKSGTGSYCVSALLEQAGGNCNADCTSGTNTDYVCLQNVQ